MKLKDTIKKHELCLLIISMLAIIIFIESVLIWAFVDFMTNTTVSSFTVDANAPRVVQEVMENPVDLIILILATAVGITGILYFSGYLTKEKGERAGNG